MVVCFLERIRCSYWLASQILLLIRNACLLSSVNWFFICSRHDRVEFCLLDFAYLLLNNVSNSCEAI
ncbi:hypothetical protein Peur_040631 [Populus x canadensis]